MPSQPPSPPPILFFDGYCPFCNWFVNFLLWADYKKKLRFAPLTGTTAKATLDDELKHQDTVVLFHQGHFYLRFQAIFQVFSLLGGPWKLFLIFKRLPKSPTNKLYDFFARNRNRLFGRKTTCRIPTAKEKERFLP